MITFEEVDKAYKEKLVLHKINLTINDGGAAAGYQVSVHDQDLPELQAGEGISEKCALRDHRCGGEHGAGKTLRRNAGTDTGGSKRRPP